MSFPGLRAELNPAMQPVAIPLAPVPTQVGIGWRHPHYQALLDQRPALDFIEVHSENFFAQGGAALAVLMQGRAHYPVSLHGVGLSLGSASGLDAWHLDKLADLVSRVDPIRVSDHACFARGSFAGQPVHAADLLPIPFSMQALDVLCANVQRVQDRLKRRFMVENLSSYLTWLPDDADALLPETTFLSELVRRTDCTLLVDVNNIYVNALNAQISGSRTDPVRQCMAWIDAIAASCVGELHLAGHRRVTDQHGDIVIDDHGSRVHSAVWHIFEHAVHSFGPVPTLIEWDTDIPAFEVLIGEADRARQTLQSTLQADSAVLA